MSTENKNCFFIYYIVGLLALSLVSCKPKSPINFLRGDLAEVFKTAKKAHKKVFIIITDSSCGNCNSLLENISRQKQTRKILAEEYVCYEADIENPQEHVIAEIVKCPSYPFPYFFDENGTLLAFGFPLSKDYEITNLNSIGIDSVRFAELFKLPVSSDQYKALVSLNLKATLHLGSNNAAALSIFEKSLDIAAYPYNIRFVNTIGRPLLIAGKVSQALSESYQNASDKFLYGNINEYAHINNVSKPDSSTLGDASGDYSFTRDGNLGGLSKNVDHQFSFMIKNLSDKPLVVYKVSHPCSCVKLYWSGKPIAPNESAIIKGSFNPTETGGFTKEIFVHTNSIKAPMGIYKIHGTVYE